MTAVPARALLGVALAACVSAAGLLAQPAMAAAQGDVWALLRQPGHAVLMRHSDAPGSGGIGDPPGFQLDDCTTQRNLSDGGRTHAKRTGEAFRKQGITFARVLTSPWCRCKETAQLAMGREAEVYAPLSNLVGRSEHRDEQVKALKSLLAGLGSQGPVLLVTHGIVIGAVTGINPASGEMVIVKPAAGGEPTVVGRLLVD